MTTLDIYADPVCPWCLIGKAFLDQALAQRPDHGMQITWWPFQLNPSLPPEGMDRRDYLEAKFGGKTQAVDHYTKVVEAAATAGVEINLPTITRQPNTRNAHRLIHWAAIEHKQDAVINILMQGFFAKGLDLGDPKVLADLAGQAGMDSALVARLLASDADIEIVTAREAEARQRGIDAVPTFIVAGQYIVPGAQPAALWLQVIDELSGHSPRPEGTPLQ